MDVTVAVKVTGCPNTDGFGDRFNTVVVGVEPMMPVPASAATKTPPVNSAAYAKKPPSSAAVGRRRPDVGAATRPGARDDVRAAVVR